MKLVSKPFVSVSLGAALIVGGLLLSGCATEDYVDKHIATVNMRIDGVEAKANDGIQRADAAMQAAQSAGSRADAAMQAAQAAGASASSANQRLDSLTSRVDALEAKRRPRG